MASRYLATPRVSSRAARAAGFIAALALALALAPAAQATPKYVHGVLAGGPTGGTGKGQFFSPRDVAVNLSSVADGAADPFGDPVDGYVYVVDDENHRIQVFDSDGNFQFMWGRGVLTGGADAELCKRTDPTCTVGAPANGTAGGMLNRPQGIAIDQDSGHVFVRERQNLRVQEFEADGSFVRAWGFDVALPAEAVPASAVFETCFAAAACKAGVSGTGAGQFGASTSTGPGIALHQPSGELLVADLANRRVHRFTVPANPAAPIPVPTVIGSAATFTTASSPRHLAVDDDGILYASDGESLASTEVDRYDLDAEAFLASLPLSLLVPTFSGTAGEIHALEVDASSGNLLAAVFGKEVGNPDLSAKTLELASPGAVAPSGVSVLDTHLVINGTPGWSWNGIGIDPDRDRLYLSSFVTGISPTVDGTRVFIAQEGPAPPALVTFDPYTDVEAFSATVNVQLTANGSIPAAYEVQATRADQPTSFKTIATGTVPAGASPVPVSASLSDLRAATPYLVRVITRKLYSNPDVTVEGPQLVTAAVPPSLTDVGADSLTPSSARLTGRIKANGTGATYQFEWGEGGFQHLTPIPGAPTGAGHDYLFFSESIEGLQPATTYQYRLVVTSDDIGFAPVISPTETFTTPATPPQSERAYELVSPADKLSGVGVGEWYTGPGSVSQAGRPAQLGERFASNATFGATLIDAAHAYINDLAFAERVSDTAGWVSHSPVTHPACAAEGPRQLSIDAAAPDLSLLTWTSNGGLPHILPGTCEWSDGEVNNPAWISDWEGRWELFGPTALDQVSSFDDAETSTSVAADGSAVLGTSGMGITAVGGIRGLAGPGDPTHFDWPDLAAGRTVYLDDVSAGLSDSFPGAGIRELVQVCTGGTELPTVSGGGGMTAAACAAPESGRDARLVSPYGATTTDRSSEPPQGSISADGSRAFFIAPDPWITASVPNGRNAFCTTTGQVCPAQLFVWQRNPDGSRTTRWVSRAEDGLFGAQDAALTGAVRFEGASPDGDKVFFRTNSPLTADDPNGTGALVPGGVKTGQASDSSWDLYRYDLPDGPGADPAGGELTRISAGPEDSDCNRPQSDSTNSGILRFASEDGSRVYFVCAGPLAGVDAPLDAERLSAPGGTAATTSQANLYLYDANLAEAERWRFVARMPADPDGSGLDGCATAGTKKTRSLEGNAGTPLVYLAGEDVNCVRGTTDGSFISFWSRGQLLIDDPDTTSADIYAYDATSDELSRVSAPQGGAGGTYACVPASVPGLPCFGDPGFDEAGTGLASQPLDPGARQVFFQSRSQLVAEDQDSAYDVYEWRNGALELLSTGVSDPNDGAFFLGNDLSGRNAYFATRDALTWQDTDAVADVYTARVGGGIAEPVLPPACAVLAGACKGAPSGAPAAAGAASTAFAGAGSAVEGKGKARKRCAKGKVAKKGKCVTRKAKKRAAKGKGRAGR